MTHALRSSFSGHHDAMHRGHVSAQVARLAEGFTADFTLKWLHAEVYLADVVFQLVQNEFPTHRALKQAKRDNQN